MGLALPRFVSSLFHDGFGIRILIVALEGLFYHNSCTDIMLNGMVAGLDGSAFFLCCIFSVAGRVGFALHRYGRRLAFYERDGLHGSLSMVTRCSCSGCENWTESLGRRIRSFMQFNDEGKTFQKVHIVQFHLLHCSLQLFTDRFEIRNAD